MHYKFNTIELISINDAGVNFQIAGTWNNRQFRVGIWCEYDGRDVECEPTTPGEYDPFFDEVGEGDAFFDKLCEDNEFMSLYDAGHLLMRVCWEASPRK